VLQVREQSLMLRLSGRNRTIGAYSIPDLPEKGAPIEAASGFPAAFARGAATGGGLPPTGRAWSFWESNSHSCLCQVGSGPTKNRMLPFHQAESRAILDDCVRSLRTPQPPPRLTATQAAGTTHVHTRSFSLQTFKHHLHKPAIRVP
jgi:hypothetical protein